MKSFSPAGAATKAYFGLGARTFGNPLGALSGNGGTGGGGGGPTPTFTILAGNNGGPGTGFEESCGVPQFGQLVSGAIPPIFGNDFSIGDDVAGLGPSGFSVVNFGINQQTDFTSVLILPLGQTYSTAGAAFFTNGGGCGPSTVWTWIPIAGLQVGLNYGFVFS